MKPKKEIIQHAMTFTHGGMQENELSYLFDICNNKIVVELGSMVGMSSYVIASSCRQLYCIDLWDDSYSHFKDDFQRNVYLGFGCKNAYEEFLRNCDFFLKNNKIIHYKENTAMAIQHFFSINNVDILLIDADHTYGGALRDFYTYHNILDDNGMYVFHDYGEPLFPDIKKLCDDLEKEKKLKRVCIIGRLAFYYKVPKIYDI